MSRRSPTIVVERDRSSTARLSSPKSVLIPPQDQLGVGLADGEGLHAIDYGRPERSAIIQRYEQGLFMEALVTLTLDIDLPGDLARFRLPDAVAARLQALLDRQDSGQPLTPLERDEAEGLVNLAELLTLLRLRAQRMSA
jgi:hypothetical protein